MRFDAFFDEVYRQPGETKTRALTRLQLESGVSPMALRRAIGGSQVRPETARRLAPVTDGRVSITDLVDAPTASDVRAAQPIPRRGRPPKAKPAPSDATNVSAPVTPAESEAA